MNILIIIALVNVAYVCGTAPETVPQLPEEKTNNEEAPQDLQPEYRSAPSEQSPPLGVQLPVQFQHHGAFSNVHPQQAIVANPLPSKPLPGGYYQVYQRPQVIQHNINPTIPTQQPLQPQSEVVGIYSHPKDVSDKKPVPQIEKKPSYYNKESSYASVPQQPQVLPHGNTARFVADPTKKQAIEQVSQSELQALAYRHPYPFQQHPYNYGPGATGAPVAYAAYSNPNALEAKPVKYEKTRHGIIDRMWGEMQTMRETVTSNVLSVFPNFMRNIWETIVDAFSSASARMLTVDWISVLEVVRKFMQ